MLIVKGNIMMLKFSTYWPSHINMEQMEIFRDSDVDP